MAQNLERNEDGGVGLPGFQLYHVAALSSCGIDLFHSAQSKPWISPFPPTSGL